MNANELRIGNYYRSVKFNKAVILELYDLIELSRRCDFAQIDSDVIATLIEPIELTEEWILKTNLIKGISVHNDGFSGIIKVKYNSFIGLYELFIGSESIKILEYVHQLQNLYFALINEELTL